MKFKSIILSIVLFGCVQNSYAVQKINAGISVDFVKDVNEGVIYVSPKATLEPPKVNYSDIGYFVKFKPLYMLSSREVPSSAQGNKKALILNQAYAVPSVYNISMQEGGKIDSQKPNSVEELIKQNPNRLEYIYAYAIKLRNEGKASEAIAQIERALKIDNNYALGHFLKGDILRSLGANKEAAREYYETIKINPYCTDAYFNIAKMLEEIGKVDLAISYYEMAYSINPDDLEIRNQILKLTRKKELKVSSL